MGNIRENGESKSKIISFHMLLKALSFLKWKATSCSQKVKTYRGIQNPIFKLYPKLRSIQKSEYSNPIDQKRQLISCILRGITAQDQ